MDVIVPSLVLQSTSVGGGQEVDYERREREREFRISQGTHAHWDPPNRLIYIEFQLYRSNNRGQPSDTTALVPGGCARGLYVVYWTQ